MPSSRPVNRGAESPHSDAIAPGWIETDMTAPVRTPQMRAINGEIPLRHGGPLGNGRKKSPDTAIYRASRASQFVTDEIIRVEGDYAIR